MQKNTLIFLISILSLLLFLQINEVNAQQCSASIDSDCGVPITTIGDGAVELCNDCFVCGAEDGVCPAWYSTGDVKNNVPILLKLGTNDRPTAGTQLEYSVAYQTGNDACARFGGTFLRAQTKTTKEGSWVNSAILGATVINTRSEYVRAICNDVPVTPSCDNCIDKDCITQVKGLAYSGTSNIVQGANITILPQRESLRTIDYAKSNKSNEKGEYTIDAYSGNVIVLCAAAGFESMRINVTLKPGMNVIDCNLARAACASDCTLPSSIYGERICAQECQGENGCDFGSYPTIDIASSCDRRNPGFFYELNSTKNDTHIQLTGINCCTTYPSYKYYTLFNLNAENNISNLITRKYRKVLTDGTPVDLNIIVYNK